MRLRESRSAPRSREAAARNLHHPPRSSVRSVAARGVGASWAARGGVAAPAVGLTLGPLVHLARTLAESCDRQTPLAWGDFTGTRPADSPFHALTSTAIALEGGRFVARFQSGASWVEQRYTYADRRVFGVEVDDCVDFLSAEEGGTWTFTFDADERCPAVDGPPSPFEARSAAACRAYGDRADEAGRRESGRLLAHEQRHYDIACAFAAQANLLLDQGVDAADVDLGLHAALQDRYDRETGHGCNAAAQRDWDENVAAKVAEQLSGLRP